jgi:hypothetical protein
MMINNQPGSIRDNRPSTAVGSISHRTPLSAGWRASGDAIQLSRLSGVLNAFDTNASLSTSRVDRIAKTVRAQNYSPDSQVLSHRLIAEMLSEQ